MAGTTTYLGISYPTNTDYVKDGASAIQTVATGFDSAVAIPTYQAQTGTTYTFALSDIGKTVTANNAGAQTYTIPPNASVVWPTNATLNVVSLGAGTVTFAAGAGVTVTNLAATLEQYQSASLIRTGLNAWTVVPFGGGVAPLTDSSVSGTTGSPTVTTYTSGGINYKAYAFTGAGTITFTKTGLVDALVIAGGGGGGTSENATAGDAAAGGGAGGYRCTVSGESSGGGAAAENQLYIGQTGTYYAAVGAGGAGQISAATLTNGVNGSNSNFGFLTSVGGGGGGAQETAGSLGGSGGGGGGYIVSVIAGGAGTSSQGFAGGPSVIATRSGGGGGGAAEIGSTDAAREGGDGVASSITGTSVTRGGGGGGGVGSNLTTTAAGGDGGGGTGGASNADNATAGTANTGGGGGGGGAGKNSKNGGSGIVIVRVLA